MLTHIQQGKHIADFLKAAHFSQSETELALVHCHHHQTLQRIWRMEGEGHTVKEWEGHTAKEWEGRTAKEWEGRTAKEWEGHTAKEWEGHTRKEWEAHTRKEWKGHTEEGAAQPHAVQPMNALSWFTWRKV